MLLQEIYNLIALLMVAPWASCEWVCVFERERESVCVCVCVRERERERWLGGKKHVDCAEEDRWTLKIERGRESGRTREGERERERLHHGHSCSCRGD